MGKIFFLGGIGGVCLFLIAGGIAWAVLRKKKRILLETIEKEYQ